MTDLPLMATIRQPVPRAPLADIDGAVREALARGGLLAQVRSGMRVAVGAGSRGVASYDVVVRAVVAALRDAGAEPFVFPAMGSHGGATAQGQLDVLAELGVTPERVGCPVVSTMEAVRVGETAAGVPVFCDADAHGSDGIIVVNRVKIHTDFHGPTESGLTKMLAIGMGKREGAEAIHARGARGLREDIPEVAAVQIARSPVLGGLAIVEDGAHAVSAVRAIAAGRIAAEEPAVLEAARRLLPRLPANACDVLVVERMGKDISGVGMDNNVLGRMYIDGEPELESPRVGTVVALRLTPASHGNATGVGFADLVTRELLDAIDHEVTGVNIATSGFPRRGRIPPAAPTDHEAITRAVARYGAGVRVLIIRDTLSLEVCRVSESMLSDVLARPGVELVRPPAPLAFDGAGRLTTS